MAKKKSTRKVVDVSKPEGAPNKAGTRYTRQVVNPKAERKITPEVTAAGKFIGDNPKLSGAARKSGKPKAAPKPLPQMREKKAVKPSKRVTVFTPGSREARAALGKGAGALAAVEAKEGSNKPTPLLKGQRLPRSGDTGLPKDWNLSEGTFPGNPQYSSQSDSKLDNPIGGTFAHIGRLRAGHVNTFVSAMSKLKPDLKTAEAARAAFHSLKSTSPVGAKETGICSTPGCSRTTEGGGGSCPGGKCEVPSSPTTPAPRKRD